MVIIKTNKKKSRLWCFIICILFSFIVFGGCGSTNEYLDKSGIQQEYQEAIAELELPPGFIFPDEIRIEGTSFQKGVGIVSAQSYWMAAWQTEWLEQRNKDEERAQRALDVLRNEVYKSEFFLHYLDEYGRECLEEYLTKAELGDPSGYQYDRGVNPEELIRVVMD
jgi:hypothetical protein